MQTKYTNILMNSNIVRTWGWILRYYKLCPCLCTIHKTSQMGPDVQLVCANSRRMRRPDFYPIAGIVFMLSVLTCGFFRIPLVPFAEPWPDPNSIPSRIPMPSSLPMLLYTYNAIIENDDCY